MAGIDSQGNSGFVFRSLVPMKRVWELEEKTQKEAAIN